MNMTQNKKNKTNNTVPKAKNKAKYEPKNKTKYVAKLMAKVKAFEMKAEKEEFPTLADAATIVTDTKQEKFPRSGAVHTSYIVASSYLPALTRERHETYSKPDYRPREPRVNPRNQAFATLENKDALTKTLTCTKACRHVTEGTKEVDGVVVYGVCHRTVCTFAHSLEELQDPICTFGEGCRYVNGGGRNSGVCWFRHPFETREMYVERIGKKNTTSNLPQTAELTRVIRAPRVGTKLDDKIPEVEKALQEFKRDNTKTEEPKSKETLPKETLLRVPKEMFEQAMELAIRQGLSNLRIEITE